MKKFLTPIFILVASVSIQAQSLYFPPLTGNTWETTDPATLGWCPAKIDSMLNYLGDNDTKAFIVLKNGKIVIEKYYGTFTQDSLWYWASAGKSLTSVLVGIAQEEGDINIDSSSSHYMGNGWTSLTPQQEKAITVRHQLTMTSGLDDGAAGGADCTLPPCLVYEAAPGTRWAYHNAPYTLLDSVIHNATGMTLNSFVTQKVKQKTGMTGFYFKSGYNNVYISNARSMARFGLLMLNKGKWNNQTVLGDTTYYNDMIHTSQNPNLSYGYLWWLAGEASYMMPQAQFVFPGSAISNAPDDMFAALGKNGQIINVVPSQNLVLIRMGNEPGSGSFLVSNLFDNEIWGYMNDLTCATNSITENNSLNIKVYPNPTTDLLYLGDGTTIYDNILVSDVQGKEIMNIKNVSTISVNHLKSGLYFLKVAKANEGFVGSFVKE